MVSYERLRVVIADQKARFVSWILEGPEIRSFRGVPLLAGEPLYGLGEDMLNAEQCSSLMEQPWLIRSALNTNANFYIYTDGPDAFLGWCILTGYLTPVEVEHIRAIITLYLMEDE